MNHTKEERAKRLVKLIEQELKEQDTLENCPFCTGEGQYSLNPCYGHMVICESCHKFLTGESKEEVIRLWNRKAKEQKTKRQTNTKRTKTRTNTRQRLIKQRTKQRQNTRQKGQGIVPLLNFDIHVLKTQNVVEHVENITPLPLVLLNPNCNSKLKQKEKKLCCIKLTMKTVKPINLIKSSY